MRSCPDSPTGPFSRSPISHRLHGSPDTLPTTYKTTHRASSTVCFAIRIHLIRHRLREMFKATRKTCFDDVLPLPKLEDGADRVRRGRMLLVVSPDSKIPPEEVQKFFGRDL